MQVLDILRIGSSIMVIKNPERSRLIDQVNHLVTPWPWNATS